MVVHTYNLLVISYWIMLYISIPSLFFSKVILFISNGFNFKLILFFILFLVQYLQWCCVLKLYNWNMHMHFLVQWSFIKKTYIYKDLNLVLCVYLELLIRWLFWKLIAHLPFINLFEFVMKLDILCFQKLFFHISRLFILILFY